MPLDSHSITSLREQFTEALARIKVRADLEMVRVDWLGKEGTFRGLFSELRTVSPEEKPKVAAALNQLKDDAERLIREKELSFEQDARRSAIEGQFIDVSLPGSFPGHGTVHPISRIERKIEAILRPFGFKSVFGPEIESEFYCFDALNTPLHHPSRDMQDTFYTSHGWMLRTHTTSVQARALEKGELPIKIASYGRVFRNENEDASHQCMFHQFELVWLEKGVTLSNLLALITHILKQLYPRRIKVRFVPSYYPYVEPGVLPQIDCANCRGDGCSFCKGAGWVDVGGAGMISAPVLRGFNYDPKEVQGFAFGLGTSRLAAQEFALPSLKSLYDNDVRLLRTLP